MNLYGFARGDPVNFSDPFGLCVEEDATCEDLVRQLRLQDGEEFKAAADLFESFDGGRVHWVTGDNAILNWDGLNRDGNPETWRGGIVNPDNGDILLNVEFSGGDRLITAVHEALHIAGLSDRRDRDQLNNAEQRAFNQLSPAARASAVRHANRLFGITITISEPRRR